MNVWTQQMFLIVWRFVKTYNYGLFMQKSELVLCNWEQKAAVYGVS